MLFAVLFGITFFLNEIVSYTAAVKAIGEIRETNSYSEWQNNIFLLLAEESIWRELVSNLTKIFDSKSTYGHSNLSIDKLKDLCLLDDNKLGLSEEVRIA